MKIRNHKLEFSDRTPVAFRRSPNQSGSITPEYLVMHFTKGASAESSINWLTNRNAKASAHLVIARDGAITQLVAFNRKAWHAGRSRLESRNGLNSFSIGIELDNYGDLIGKAGNWRTSWGRVVDDSEVIELEHKFDGKVRGWHAYTEPQLTTAMEVTAVLFDHYSLKDIVGHDDIAPGRKFDPGPAFPMRSFRAASIGRENESIDIYQTTTDLNIRTGPGTQYEKFEASPLPAGIKLDILSEQGLWREVDVLDLVNGDMDIIGWVHSRYIQRTS